MYVKRISRATEELDLPERKERGYSKGSKVMGKVQEVHQSFERLALRIAGDDILQYRDLMRGTMKDFTAAQLAYIERLVAIKKQNSKRYGR